MSDCDEDGDDIPPLEDMSEYLQKFKQTVEDGQQLSQQKTVTHDSSLLQLEEENNELSQNLQSNLLVIENKTPKISENNTVKLHTGTEPPRPVSRSKRSGNFGGMKKGFLFSSSSDKKSNKSSVSQQKVSEPMSFKGLSTITQSQVPNDNDVPFLHGQKEAEKGLEFQEVQDELKRSYPLFASKDWVTEDLLTKIDQNPTLAKAFRDPALAKVLEEFHQNPQAVFEASQHNPEIRKFLQEFCGIMGDHFTSLADQEDIKLKQPLISEQLSEEEERMKEALKKPEVQAVLQDTDIQQLIHLLKDNPGKAQQFLESNPSSDFHTKVRLLIETGVLNVQRR